ncbi:MAG: hypothetical protein FK734_05835 [Asgard group archaeon]|nr:hypothetical protein [Asgard group archaeon]
MDEENYSALIKELSGIKYLLAYQSLASLFGFDVEAIYEYLKLVGFSDDEMDILLRARFGNNWVKRFWKKMDK